MKDAVATVLRRRAEAQGAKVLQDHRRALYLDTVAKVHGGQLDEHAGDARLRAAGFPDSDNPFTNRDAPGTGGILHSVAAPLGLSRSDNLRREAGDKRWYDFTHPFHPAGEPTPLEDQRVQAGTAFVGPGVTSLAGQILAPLAEQAVNAPGGVVSAIDHPGRTARQIGHNLKETATHPQDHLGDAALMGYLGLSAAAGSGARAAAAVRAAKSGASARDVLMRPGHAGGSLLHAPEPGVDTLHVPGARPSPVPGPLEEAEAAADKAHFEHVEAQNRYQQLAGHPNATLEQIERARVRAENAAKSAAAIADEQQARGVVRNLHTDAQDVPVAEGPRPAVQVDRLRSRSTLARLFQSGFKNRGTLAEPSLGARVGRNPRLQKALLDEQVPTSRRAVGKAYREIFSPQATAGRELRAKGRFESNYVNALPREQMHAVNGIVHGLSRGEHAAISVAGIEGHNAFANPEEVIGRHVATHQRFIEEGKGVESNQQHIADLRMAQHVLENPTDRFKRALALTAHSSRQTEEQLIARLPKAERAAARKQYDARRANIASMYHGALYEHSTPGKLGQSPARDRAEALVKRLQRAYDRLDAKGHRGGYRPVTRPRTEEEARARLDELDKKYDALVDQVHKKLNPAWLPEHNAEQLSRNERNAQFDRQAAGLTKTGMKVKKLDAKIRDQQTKIERAQQAGADDAKLAPLRKKLADLQREKDSYKGARLRSSANSMKGGQRLPLLKKEQRDDAEAALHDILNRNESTPWVQNAIRQLDEREALKTALHPEMFEPVNEAGFGTVESAEFKRTRPGMERQGAALSVAKDDLERADTAARKREMPTGFLGNTIPAPDGSFFFPMSPRYTEKTPRGGARGGGRSPGEYGLAPPDASRYGVSRHEFTGKSVEEAKQHQVANAIVHRAFNVNRLIQTEQFYDDAWRIASPTRRSNYDVPLRYGKEIQTELKQFFTDLADRLHGTPDELLKLDKKELETLLTKLEAHEHDAAAVGTQIKGVRWIDSRYLKDNGEVSVRGKLEKTADAITNPVRTLQLYARPAYILNLAGNLGMQGISDGVRVFPSMTQSVRADTLYRSRDVGLIDSLVGNSRSRSFNVEQGPWSNLNTRLAEGWNAVTDLYSRRGAWFAEAGRAGYKTPDEISQLLHDPTLHRKLEEVTRRANKNIVDYDSLTPFEKNVIRRIVYFYPWVSRGTIWALRAMVEHPGKTFTLAQLGEIGAENAHKHFGDMPDWAKQLGLIGVGEAHGPNKDIQDALNPASIWTPTTLVQAGEALMHPLSPTVGVGNLMTPAAGIGVSFGAGSSGETQPKGIFRHAGGWLKPFSATIETLPQIQAARRSGFVPWLAGGPSKTYPETGIGPAAGPYGIGGMYARGVSKSALHDQFEKQQPPERRAHDRVQAEQTKLHDEATRLGLMKKGQPLPAIIEKAYRVQDERMVMYARVGKDQHARLQVDLDLGVKLGTITPEQRKQLLTASSKLTSDEILKRRKVLYRDYLGGKTLTAARTEIRKKGGDLHP